MLLDCLPERQEIDVSPRSVWMSPFPHSLVSSWHLLYFNFCQMWYFIVIYFFAFTWLITNLNIFSCVCWSLDLLLCELPVHVLHPHYCTFLWKSFSCYIDDNLLSIFWVVKFFSPKSTIYVIYWFYLWWFYHNEKNYIVISIFLPSFPPILVLSFFFPAFDFSLLVNKFSSTPRLYMQYLTFSSNILFHFIYLHSHLLSALGVCFICLNRGPPKFIFSS